MTGINRGGGDNLQPSERAFPTLAQRSLSGGSSPLRATLQDGGRVISTVTSFYALPPHLCLHIYSSRYTLLTGDNVSTNRMSDPVAAEESSLADGWCSLPSCCSLSCEYQQTFLPGEQPAIHQISSRVVCAILEPQWIPRWNLCACGKVCGHWIK